MKGIVFSEFLEMVDDSFGELVTETIIDKAAPESQGAYTAVGTYDHMELVRLIAELSKATAVPVKKLVHDYGVHLFGRFTAVYPQFFEGADDAFTFLYGIEDNIHSEVRKLYPDAQLPRIEASRSGDALRLEYHSIRCLADLASGLIDGCLNHFGEMDVRVDRRDLPPGDGSVVEFMLRRT